jgi:hypothetical protein
MSVDGVGKECRWLQFGGIYSIRRVNDLFVAGESGGALANTVAA